MLATFLAVVTGAALWGWAVGHQLVIGWVLAAMIERLPLPDDKSSKFYAYFFSIVQFFLAANTRRAQDAVAVVANKP